jgi:TonB family protein
MFRLVLVIAVGGISHLAAADLSGSWTGTLETNGSRVPVYLTLEQQDDKFTGSIAIGNDAQPVPIENAEFHDDKLAFGVRDNAGQFVAFRLSLTGATLNGESTVGLQTSKATLRRGGVLPVGGGGGSSSGDRAPLSNGSDFGSGQGGGGVYRVGGGVSAPALIHKVEPKYSEEALKAKYQGTVILYVEISPDGRAVNPRVVRSLGLGLDEKAIEAVRKWKFRPGYKDGKAVTVVAQIEVNFRL